MRRHSLATLGLFVLCLGCSIPNQDVEDANKALFVEMTDAINARQLDRLDALVAANLVRHSQATPNVQGTNLSEFKDFLRQDFDAVPDSRQEIEMMVADGNMLAAYVNYRGTQTGPLGPFPPSGKEIDLRFIGFLRIEHGKIAEIWVEWDNLTVLTQLGHFPPGDATPETPAM